MVTRDETQIYVGNLPNDVRTKEIGDLFYKYGRVRYIDLKTCRGPSFAFVEFSDHRNGPQRKFNFRIRVTNLPRPTRWHDLKDYMQSIKDIVFGIVEFTSYDVKYAIRKFDGRKFRFYNVSCFEKRQREKPPKYVFVRKRKEDVEAVIVLVPALALSHTPVCSVVRAASHLPVMIATMNVPVHQNKAHLVRPRHNSAFSIFF
ncbi:hypothetical protein CRE_27700 [Caenorhabditis remanei]|nr:hypothetical protein CRE_27700 [Caenorhabditis remanei]